MDILNSFRKEQTIAYFSMEIALTNDIPSYSGGLGVLAGDTVRAAADISAPFLAVTLISRKGYFRQEITSDGWQKEYPLTWEVEKFVEPLSPRVQVVMEGRTVSVGAWAYYWKSMTGGIIPVIFLDTNLPENTADDRQITDCLYGGDRRYRLKQEIILGIGGTRMLQALGLNVRKYHINEGHAALLTLELLQQNKKRLEEVWSEDQMWDTEAVKNFCVFTTHTPVEAGHDKFSYDLVKQVLNEPIPFLFLQKLAGNEDLNMTRLALNLSGYINGVAKRHTEVSRNMFPGYTIHDITNGVHSFTWTSNPFRDLFDQYIPGWAHQPELLTRVDIIPDEEIWDAHQAGKKHLLAYVRDTGGGDMDEDTLTIGFARRMTAYKRPHFLFTDTERLKRVRRKGDFQIIYAGKAHPQDEEGKRIIQTIYQYCQSLKNEIKIVFLEDYNLEIAKKMVSGVDVWLNTPQRPMEASGTSGMKAAHNGVLNFSILDGWWIEGCLEGITGWSIGPTPTEKADPAEQSREEIDDLYNKLEYIILPTYYQQIDWWIKMMKSSIGKIASYFNTHRMMEHYVTEAYFHQAALPPTKGTMLIV
ncbi:MAG: alpha-glucan family phosphorylase [Candidatus Atribacteria bacterium]|nr:alpha-glucan family phosphorylase [Candidatus Atribacteria bacterium]